MTRAFFVALLLASIAHAQDDEASRNAPDEEPTPIEQTPQRQPPPDLDIIAPHPPPPRDYVPPPPTPPPPPPVDEWSTHGWEDPCGSSAWGRPIGPLQVPLLNGMIGVPHHDCMRNQIELGGDLYLVADPANFYGNLRIDTRVSASAVLGRSAELFVTWEPFRRQSLISAVSATYMGLGYLSIGMNYQFFHEGHIAVSVGHRSMFPTTTGLDQHSMPWGHDLGFTMGWALSPNFRLHSWLGVAIVAGLGIDDTPSTLRAGMRLGLGVDWHPWEWLAFVAEFAGGLGYRDALDYIALQPGVRLAFGPEVALEISAALPVLGAERALVAGWLMVSWRPGSPPSGQYRSSASL